MPFINFKTGNIDNMGDYASMTALISMYNQNVNENDIVTYGHEVCKKYLNGDKVAQKVIDKWINNIVVQLLAISVFYNPEIICIGGGISEEEWFIKEIQDKYKKLCVSYVEADVITTKIDKCKFNNDANILGAILDVSKKK